MPPLIFAWDFHPIRLDNTPFEIFFNHCTKATSEMGKEKKRKGIIGIEEGSEGGR